MVLPSLASAYKRFEGGRAIGRRRRHVAGLCALQGRGGIFPTFSLSGGGPDDESEGGALAERLRTSLQNNSYLFYENYITVLVEARKG